MAADSVVLDPRAVLCLFPNISLDTLLCPVGSKCKTSCPINASAASGGASAASAAGASGAASGGASAGASAGGASASAAGGGAGAGAGAGGASAAGDKVSSSAGGASATSSTGAIVSSDAASFYADSGRANINSDAARVFPSIDGASSVSASDAMDIEHRPEFTKLNEFIVIARNFIHTHYEHNEASKGKFKLNTIMAGILREFKEKGIPVDEYLFTLIGLLGIHTFSLVIYNFARIGDSNTLTLGSLGCRVFELTIDSRGLESITDDSNEEYFFCKIITDLVETYHAPCNVIPIGFFVSKLNFITLKITYFVVVSSKFTRCELFRKNNEKFNLFKKKTQINFINPAYIRGCLKYFNGLGYWLKPNLNLIILTPLVSGRLEYIVADISELFGNIKSSPTCYLNSHYYPKKMLDDLARRAGNISYLETLKKIKTLQELAHALYELLKVINDLIPAIESAAYDCTPLIRIKHIYFHWDPIENCIVFTDEFRIGIDVFIV